MRANGVIVFIPKYGIEGTVLLTPKEGSKLAIAAPFGDFVLDEERQRLTSQDGHISCTVFDKVAVRISIVIGAAHRRQLTLEWVDRNLLPASELMA